MLNDFWLLADPNASMLYCCAPSVPPTSRRPVTTPGTSPAMVHEPSLVPLAEGVVDLIRALDGQTAAGLRAAQRPIDTSTPLPGPVRCRAGARGACADADCAVVASRPVSSVARGCAIECAGAADTAACAFACIGERAGVSSGCGLCFLTETQCALGPCLAECALTAASDGCLRCRVREGCYAKLEACGLEAP